MDVQTLLSAIDVLSRPQQHSSQTIADAQQYCDAFKRDNGQHLPQFFSLFASLDDKTQTQHKFWVLGAISDVMQHALAARLA